MSPRTIGIGIIGTGFARTTQIPCIKATPGYEIVGLMSRNMTRAYDLAKEFGLRRAFDDVDKMLQVPEIELVIVSSPPHMHLPHTLAALRAGKHVLCEKPTALHAGEAEEMVAAARASGRLALIDHELRFHPRRQHLVRMIREGFLGQLYSYEYRVAGSFRLDPGRAWSWWSDLARGGGMWGAVGSHVVDAIRSSIGEISEVRGELTTGIAERPDPETGLPKVVTADDHAVAWLRLASGGQAMVTLSALAREEPTHRIVIHGTRGSLVLDEQNRLWQRTHDATTMTEVVSEDAPPPPTGCQAPDNLWTRSFLLYLIAIRDALQKGQVVVPGAATFEDGLQNQSVLDAVRESARRADWVPVAGMPARA